MPTKGRQNTLADQASKYSKSSATTGIQRIVDWTQHVLLRSFCSAGRLHWRRHEVRDEGAPPQVGAGGSPPEDVATSSVEGGGGNPFRESLETEDALLSVRETY